MHTQAKKLVLFTAMLLLGSLASTAALITSTGKQPEKGNGNNGSPYEIWTADELRWFVHYENTRHWYPDDYAKLMADIDLSSICGPDKGSWIPLGVAEESGAVGAFYGNFNGNGHTVSGMYIDGKDTDEIGSKAGFFGLMTAGSVYDFTVEGDIVNAYKPEYTGGMVAKIDTKSTAMSKDLNFSNCEARVGIWFEEKGGAPSTLYFTGHYIGGFLGNSSKTDVGITIDHCVSSGDINFDNASAYSAVGAFIGSIGNNKTTNLNYCSAATSLNLPFIQYVEEQRGTLQLKLTGCVNRGPMAYKLDRIHYDTYFRFTNCIYSDRLCDVPSDDDNGHIVDTNSYRCDDQEMFTNGFACYTINSLCGGNFFTQTLGTDKMPFPGSEHKKVYQVKEYTSCANEDFVYVFSNGSSDITDKRNHTFVADQSKCTVCHSAVNPDYGILKDAEGYYLAATATDIEWLWNLVNVSGVTNAKIRLTADIDMKNEAMEPLAQFSGIFDGQGHILSNINISCSGTDKVGLVGNLSGSIRNLTLSGTVSGVYMKYLGAFAGYAGLGSSITSVRNDCKVKAVGTMNGSVTMYMGGIVGFTDGSIAYAINNGPVVDASVCTGKLTRFMAGVAGMVSIDNPQHLVNNAVVGAQGNAASAGVGSAIANMLQNNHSSDSYCVLGISNPGLEYFFSEATNPSDSYMMPVKVGSGELAWMLAGKDYDADDTETHFFGQTIGSDLVPYPGVSDAHKGVYNKKLYYTCSDYTEYSNSPEDGSPLAHNFDATEHFCTACYIIDEKYVPKDPDTKVYLISTEDQFNIFSNALFAAKGTNKAMKFASASIQNDLDFTSHDFEEINILYGRIHGNGNKINLGDKNKDIVHTIESDAVVEYLDVEFANSATKHLNSWNYGQIIGCNVKGGMPSYHSYGLVNNCSGENLDGFLAKGRFSNCLVKNYTNGTPDCYRLYNSNVADNVDATYTVIDLEKGESGELAYQMSHGNGSCEWGQDLDNDAAPRIYFGQTPASGTYVTRLTSYSVENKEGKVEYVNAGMGLEAAPGYYKVCEDAESWTTHPAYNFIVDKGDGTYNAEHINLDPTAQHYLPFAVNADKFSFKEIDSESGDMVAKTYAADEIVPLIFPLDMPVTNINGTVYLFDGYDIGSSRIVFTSQHDFDRVPAYVPMLVKATGGSILNADLGAVTVMPMKEAGYSELEASRFMQGFMQQTLPVGKTVEDSGYVAYYMLNGDGTKAVRTTEAAKVAGQFSAYFSLPYGSETSPGIEVPVVLTDTRELKTSHVIEWDLFNLPYGITTDGTWSEVTHLNDSEHPAVFYGNDINEDNHADLTGYSFLYLHGTPNQKYNLYLSGADPTEITFDEDGDEVVNLENLGGSISLRGIRTEEGGTIAEDAFAKVYKFLDNDGISLSGYGTLAEDHKGYSLYEATGISNGITLTLTNPNALVIGGGNIKGVNNLITPNAHVEQGFTAQSLSITDGKAFCYDYSVRCDNVAFTRDGIKNDEQYVTAILPFAVNTTAGGIYEYVDCDAENIYFNTPATGVIEAYVPIVISVGSLNKIELVGADLKALLPNGTFNITPAPKSSNGMRYGFVTSRQQDALLTGDEVKDYHVYGFSYNSCRFVKAATSFSINPFRAFFLLPKNTSSQVRGNGAAAHAPSSFNVVIDGETIGDGGLTTGIYDATADDAETQAYDLYGFPISSSYRGIAIRNGKKIIIK